MSVSSELHRSLPGSYLLSGPDDGAYFVTTFVTSQLSAAAALSSSRLQSLALYLGGGGSEVILFPCIPELFPTLQ